MNYHHIKIIKPHLLKCFIDTFHCFFICFMLSSNLRYNKHFFSWNPTIPYAFSNSTFVPISLRCINMSITHLRCSFYCVSYLIIINKPSPKSKLWNLYAII